MKNKTLKSLITIIPHKVISKAAGKFTNSRPSKILIKPYSKLYKINLNEIEKPINEYKNMTEFFTRKLSEGARNFNLQSNIVSSPVDGTVSEFGNINEGSLIQAKGINYTVENLIGDKKLASKYKNGSFITIYLSPKDYHRIHIPLDSKLMSYSYIRGRLFPVNSIGVKEVKGLFTKNERLISNFQYDNSHYSLVKVGAFIVGSVKVNYENNINYKEKIFIEDIKEDIKFSKGDEIGKFEFGSTIILLFENKIDFSDNIKSGSKINLGEDIGTL